VAPQQRQRQHTQHEHKRPQQEEHALIDALGERVARRTDGVAAGGSKQEQHVHSVAFNRVRAR
jgi:hypothetical protein